MAIWTLKINNYVRTVTKFAPAHSLNKYYYVCMSVCSYMYSDIAMFVLPVKPIASSTIIIEVTIACTS